MVEPKHVEKKEWTTPTLTVLDVETHTAGGGGTGLDNGVYTA